MRILHTSDWHLGKKLERLPRLDEQRGVMREITDIARDEKIDLVIIAGDIFDSFTPGGDAEALFYDTVSEMSEYSAVAVIPGNHDDAAKLCAAAALAERNGIFLLGDMNCTSTASRLRGKCRLVESGLGYIVLETGGDHSLERAVLAFLPYPLDSRISRQLNETIDKDEKYSARVRRWFALGASKFGTDTINLGVSHLFVAGSEKSGDEYDIELGTAKLIDKDSLPDCGYLALGHVHKYQKVSTAKNAYYSGAILAYSFDDTNNKFVNVVDIAPGAPAVINKYPLKSGKKLVRVSASSLLEAEEKLSALDNCLTELTLNLDAPLLDRENKELAARFPFVAKRILRLPENNASEFKGRAERSLPEIFSAFYKSRRGGEPDEKLVNLFLELMEEEK